MLSYRHSFHAGNFADVLKHIVAVEILQHFVKKDKPFEYIDTHAGAGLYDLRSDTAQKLAEHTDGIAKLMQAAGSHGDAEPWPELADYLELVRSFSGGGDMVHYPGSPLLALYYMRRQDRAWLYELHPQDVKKLERNTANNRKVRVHNEDGLKGMVAIMPPASRRAFVLIDPSYEVKSEYEDVVTAIVAAHRRFATGTYALWYPVVERERIDRLEKKLKNTGIRDIQRFELGVAEDTEESGMTAAGMIVINPPWGLRAKMEALLPRLANCLGDTSKSVYRCDVLVAE